MPINSEGKFIPNFVKQQKVMFTLKIRRFIGFASWDSFFLLNPPLEEDEHKNRTLKKIFVFTWTHSTQEHYPLLWYCWYVINLLIMSKKYLNFYLWLITFTDLWVKSVRCYVFIFRRHTDVCFFIIFKTIWYTNYCFYTVNRNYNF